MRWSMRIDPDQWLQRFACVARGPHARQQPEKPPRKAHVDHTLPQPLGQYEGVPVRHQPDRSCGVGKVHDLARRWACPAASTWRGSWTAAVCHDPLPSDRPIAPYCSSPMSAWLRCRPISWHSSPCFGDRRCSRQGLARTASKRPTRTTRRLLSPLQVVAQAPVRAARPAQGPGSPFNTGGWRCRTTRCDGSR